MPARIGNITFDCANPDLVADFWAAALGYVKQGSDERYAAIIDPNGVSPRLYFQKVPEPKTVKNRVHLDLNVPDMEAEVDRLVGLGARKVRVFDENGETWTVMNDPEGNEFCVQPE